MPTWSADVLAPDQIHVHVLHLSQAGMLPRFNRNACLPSDEVSQAEQFKSQKRQTEYLWSRFFLRGLLAKYLARPSQAFKFFTQVHGKPYLKNETLQFNLSHTQGWIACALGWQAQGIDIENLAAHTHTQEHWPLLAQRYFSPEELAYVHAQPSPDQARTFINIFTMKEAYIKALGCGLSMPLNSFTVPLPISRYGQLGAWNFLTYQPSPSHTYLTHVCENPQAHELTYQFYTWDEHSLTRELDLDGSAGK